jgi:seryl-tRNA synthetase
MHDIRAIRADPKAFEAAMRRRGLAIDTGAIVHADEVRRRNLTTAQENQEQANAQARLIGEMKRNGQDTALLEIQARSFRDTQAAFEKSAEAAKGETENLLRELPNILDAEVPDGADEASNRVLSEAVAAPDPGFVPRQHFELGEALGLMDFAAAAKLSGARFTVLRGALARLERALGQWMLDLHTEEHGYTEVSPPLLVNNAAVYGVGQLPKFADDMFRTTDGRFLIPTAEVPLTNLVAGEILAHDALPIRVTALTPCFRSEAGSAGRDTRGMLRQHQFWKCELVSITRPEDSDAEHERMTQCAERVLTELGLTWRRVFLCAGDTGFSAARTYDLEVWLPGQGAWREISSCSNTRAFQARRMGARYRPAEGKGTAFVHTLNGSGVAVGRALIAVLETFQQADGSVLVPPVLRPAMGGLERIAA